MLKSNGAPKDQCEEEEISKVEELRNALGPLNSRQKLFCTDSCLRRYLRARNWNIKKAKHMLQDTLKWRESYKPEDIVWEDVEKEYETGKMYKANFTDKKGRPVIVMTPRYQNTSSHVDQIQQVVYMMENATLHLPPGEEHFLWIIDFQGWTVSKASPLKTVRETAHILQNHFPERLAVGIMLNAPKIFEYTWKLWKPFIDPVSYQKARFVYTNDPSSLKSVSDLFDKDKLILDYNYDHLQYSKMMQADDAKRKSYWDQAEALDQLQN